MAKSNTPKDKPQESDSGLKKPQLDFLNQSKKEDIPSVKSGNPEPFKKTDVYKEFEKRDIAQIDNMLKGFMVNEPFYEQEDVDDGEGGVRTVYGISITGVLDLEKIQGNIGTLGFPQEEHFKEGGEIMRWVYHIQAIDYEKNITNIGTGEAPRYKTTANGKIEDPFGRRIAISIGKRNAIKDLLKQHLIVDYFNKWYKEKYGYNPDDSKIIIVNSSTNFKSKIK